MVVISYEILQGGIIWNDYTKFDHGPLATNFGYKSDIKTTSISNQGHVVAYLRCRDVTSDSVSSSYHPVTGTSQVRADVFDTPYRRTPDSHYNYSLKEKDRQRSLLFETTIEGIDPTALILLHQYFMKLKMLIRKNAMINLLRDRYHLNLVVMEIA